MATPNNVSWETVFDYLTEDISTYCWVVESWDNPPEGNTQSELLWEALNSRSRGGIGLSKIESAPGDYKDSAQKLNRLWKTADKEFNQIIETDQETVSRIVTTDFSIRQDEIETKLKTVRKIAQDGDLIDDPAWIEDDLREAGNDFLIGFQQMANIKDQFVLNLLKKDAAPRAYVKRCEDIEAGFRKSFGFFDQLIDTLKAFEKREFGKPDWWLNKVPEWDDVQASEIPDTFLNDLMPVFSKEENISHFDCSEAENAISYAFKELPENERTRFEDHLSGCAYCSQLIHDVRFSEIKADRPRPDEIAVPSQLKEALDAKTITQEPKVVASVRIKKKSIISNFVDRLGDLFSFPQMVSAVAVACLAVFIIHNSLFDAAKQDFGISLSVTGKTTSQVQMRGEAPAYEEKILKPGNALKSGEFFKIKLVVKEDSFYYLVLEDSQGKVDLLGKGSAEKNSILEYPDHDNWYQLDQNKGIETIILIVSKESIENLPDKIKMLKEIGPEEVFQQAEIKKFYFKHE